MALWDKYQYRPGLQFESKFSSYKFIIRGRKDIFSADGTLIDVIPELAAEFASHGGEYTYKNPETGTQEIGAFINGHFFDLDQWAEEHDLTDDERQLAAKRMLWWCDQAPGDMWLHSKPRVAAPWPTYDATHHNQIPTLAGQLGLVAEALAYEVQEKNRETVVGKLKELQAAQTAEQVDEESLQAA